VARSNVQLLGMLGADVTLCGPKLLMPSQAQTLGCKVSNSFDEAIKDADVVMMLRVQVERIAGQAMASVREYFHHYALTYRRLELAKPGAVVLHPGPINRGVEIDTALADDVERNAILDQVEAGVAMRQAILKLLLKED
jgi:aspartate carbamoyltransferase catalytic subunit